MEINNIISIIGLMLTIVGAFIGVKSYWTENDDIYYGRASLSFFDINYYASMVTQRYKNGLAFLFIFLGTLLQIISFYLVGSIVITTKNYVCGITIVIFIWWITDYIVIKKAWYDINKRLLIPYLEQFKTDLNQAQKEENYKNIYFILNKGKLIEYKDINQELLIEKAHKYIKKYNLK